VKKLYEINTYTKKDINVIDFNYPFVIKDGMNDWGIKGMWSFEYFLENFGKEKVFITNNDKTESYEVTLERYINYILNNIDDKDVLYLRDWNYFESKTLIEQMNQEVYFVEDYLDQLDTKVFPSLKWIYIGPQKSKTLFHIDILMTHAWNALFTGEKKWTFIIPNEFNTTLSMKSKVQNDNNHIIYIQKPGEIIYTPSRWSHSVENLSPTIALTGNFVNHLNIRPFLNEFIKSSERM